IRAFHVTGVQTCALPIWATMGRKKEVVAHVRFTHPLQPLLSRGNPRSLPVDPGTDGDRHPGRPPALGVESAPLEGVGPAKTASRQLTGACRALRPGHCPAC